MFWALVKKQLAEIWSKNRKTKNGKKPRSSGVTIALFSVLFFFIKHSPVWILPIVTSNIINIATNPDENVVRDIALNVAFMCVMIIQNVFSNYVHVYLYSKTIRNMECNLRGSLVRLSLIHI